MRPGQRYMNFNYLTARFRRLWFQFRGFGTSASPVRNPNRPYYKITFPSRHTQPALRFRARETRSFPPVPSGYGSNQNGGEFESLKGWNLLCYGTCFVELLEVKYSEMKMQHQVIFQIQHSSSSTQNSLVFTACSLCTFPHKNGQSVLILSL